MTENFSAAFPRLPERNQPLSEGATKNQRRDRKRTEQKTNLLYTEEKPITNMEDLKTHLGLDDFPEIDESMSFELQVAAAFSQISPMPLNMMMKKKKSQQESLEKIIIEEDKLSAEELELQKQIEKIQHKLRELQHQRSIQEESMLQPPLHIVLRNLGEAILYQTSLDVKGTFDKIPGKIQDILLRVPNLIPDEIKSSGKPVSQAMTVSQAIESVSDVKISETIWTPSDDHFFKCCSFLHRTTMTGAFVVLDTTKEMISAFEKLEARRHPIIVDIVIENGISDDLTEHPSLAIKDLANARHMQQPQGVIPVMILYHKSNQWKILEKIQNNFSKGVWHPSDKEMLDRVVAIRKKMFGYSAQSF